MMGSLVLIQTLGKYIHVPGKYIHDPGNFEDRSHGLKTKSQKQESFLCAKDCGTNRVESEISCSILDTKCHKCIVFCGVKEDN